jgi:ParB-like chromosome segregation protein Spo0J
MKKINILEIRIDGGTQPRKEINYEIVKEYAEHMREGTQFPPVIVFFDGAEYWLADGFHRYHATKSNSTASIEAEIKEGSLDDAILYALGANAKHGLTMSSEDKRRAIQTMLNHLKWKEWTNAEIARHIGVSAMTVTRVKTAMATEETTVKKYINKHGQEGQINTTKLKTKAKSTKPDVTSYDDSEDKLRELTDVINQLSEENAMLRDKIALGQWDASDIEKIDIEETVVFLREQVKVLEIDNKALRESRDMFQNRNAELMKSISSLQRKLKKSAE